jgi:integrase
LACPGTAKRKHGKLRVRQELPPAVDADGKETRRTFRRLGYGTVTEAEKDLDKVRALLDLAGDDRDWQEHVAALLLRISKDRSPIPDPPEVKRKLGVGVELDGRLTVADLLLTWVDGKKTRATTNSKYRSHIQTHLIPHLGHLRADRLNDQHVTAMFDRINEQNEVILAENAARREQEQRCKYEGGGMLGRPKGPERERLAAERVKLAAMPPYRKVTGPMTQQRIRATLRSALNSPLGRRHVIVNPASRVEMLPAKRPKATLWTDAHVARWRATGEIPSAVMVWTPQQIGAFLDHAEGHRLFPLYYLVSFRGLRRGEAVGQDDSDVDLDGLLLTVSREIVQDGWEAVESLPKTDGSAATIALDTLTAQVLREHRTRRLAEKEAAGDKWVETGKFFTTETGEWLHPAFVSDEFKRLCEAADLPPINLRDLRHLAATLIHAGGGDLFAIKETLRHSSIKLAGDTYTSLLVEVDRTIAEAASLVVPRTRKQVDEIPDPAPRE